MGGDYFRLVILALYFIVASLAVVDALIFDIFNKRVNLNSRVLFLSLLLGLIFLFGFRDLSVGTDTANYDLQYLNYKTYDFGPDFIMKYIMMGLNLFFSNSTVFFVFMATTYVLTMFFALRNLAKVFDADVFLTFFTLLSLFFFYNLGVNIIRQGCSLAFLLLGISIYLRFRKIKHTIFFFIVSLGFHITSIVPILVVVVIYYFNRLRIILFLLVFICSILLSQRGFSLLDAQDILTRIFLDEKFNIYLTNESLIYEVGFRGQFVVFNTVFLLIFLFIRAVYNSKPYRPNYDFVLKVYIILSSIFFMTFQMPYSDRWGIMSWVFIPVLSAPLFSFKFRFRVATLGVIFYLVVFIIFLKNLNQF